MGQHQVVLVGVDGSEAGHAAVRYAAAEAHRRDGALRLAHVLPREFQSDPAGDSPANAGQRREARSLGYLFLNAARRQAEEVLPPERVTTVLLAGRRVSALLGSAAPTASLVVLGDERGPGMERIATASVLVGVAAHSPVPVVAVPAGWSPADGRIRVVAAIKDFGRAAGPVQRALDVAQERGAELVLLHAWELPTAYGGMYVREIDMRTWEIAAREELEKALKTVPRPPADVEVWVDVRRGQAAGVLVAASSEADLLLIWRRPRGFPFGHLGGTGRAVLRESRCPVMVIPPAAEPVAVDDASAGGVDAHG